MSDSLVLGALDLTAGPFSVLFDSDLGEPETVTRTIQSLFIDGSIVSGQFSDNRAVSMLVKIEGGSRSDLALWADALIGEVDKQANTLTWTPDGGQPQILEVFRGQMRIVLQQDDLLRRRYRVVIPARPFVKAPAAQSVAAVGSATVMASFESTPEPDYTYTTAAGSPSTQPGTRTSSVPAGWSIPVGTYCMAMPIDFYTAAAGGANVNYCAANASTAFVPLSGAPIDLSGYTMVSAYLGVSDLRYAYSVSFTLKDGAGKTTTATALGNAILLDGFNRLDAPLASFVPQSGFNPATVASMQVTISCQGWGGPPGSGTFYLDGFEMWTTGSAVVATTNGAVYEIPVSSGSARSEAAVTVTKQAGGTLDDLLLYRPPVAWCDATTPMLLAFTTNAVTTSSPMKLRGTYTLLATATTATTNTATLSVQQKVNGVNVGTALSLTATRAASSKWLNFGEVTFPLIDIPAESTWSLTFTLSGTSTTGEVLMLLDTRGQVVWLNGAAMGATYVWCDEPDLGTNLGGVWSGTAADRSDARDQLAIARVSGGPLILEPPGTNYLLAYSTSGKPGVVVTFTPRWLLERTA